MKKLVNHIPADGCKPQIEYPCLWQYKLIGHDQGALEEAARQCLQERPHCLARSNVSSGGKYISMNLEVTVADEAERLQIHRALAEHVAVKVVL